MKKLFFMLALVAMGLPLLAQKYQVMADKSTLKWSGKKLAYGHHGTIGLKEGSFEIADNKLSGGKFIIDMNSMVNVDIEDADKNARLIGHLKSDDFFGVATYPDAVLVIKGSTPLTNGKAVVNGELTIKGKTKPISFEVEQTGVTFSSTLHFDRSEFDVKYGSGKFFENLGDQAIADEIAMEVSIVGMRQK